MTGRHGKAVSHTNRKGKTYYLHAAVRESGRTVYVMKTSAEGALSELPEGYGITEGVNGEVSVGRKKPTEIMDEEVALIASALERLGLNAYRCSAKATCITVYEPCRRESDLREMYDALAGPFAPDLDSWIADLQAKAPLEPVLRFQLVNKDKRLFSVDRRTYRGDGGWRTLSYVNPLPDLVKEYLPRLGKDSFFELV